VPREAAWGHRAASSLRRDFFGWGASATPTPTRHGPRSCRRFDVRRITKQRPVSPPIRQMPARAARLESRRGNSRALFVGSSEEKSLHGYASGEGSMRQGWSYINPYGNSACVSGPLDRGRVSPPFPPMARTLRPPGLKRRGPLGQLPREIPAPAGPKEPPIPSPSPIRLAAQQSR